MSETSGKTRRSSGAGVGVYLCKIKRFAKALSRPKGSEVRWMFG